VGDGPACLAMADLQSRSGWGSCTCRAVVVGVDGPDFTMLEMRAALQHLSEGRRRRDWGSTWLATLRSKRSRNRKSVPTTYENYRVVSTPADFEECLSARGFGLFEPCRPRYVLSLPPFFQRFHGDYNSRFLTLGGGQTNLNLWEM